MTASPPVDDIKTPHSVEAEEAVLGSILIDPAALMDVKHYLEPGDFFIERNEWVYAAILRIAERGDMMDYVSVVEELRVVGKLEELGGASYVTRLINNTPSGIFADTYGRIVERASLRRGLLDAASKIAQFAYDEKSDIDTALDRSRATLNDIHGRRRAEKDDSGRGIAERTVDVVGFARATQGAVGVPTGFGDLDALIGGLHKSNLIIVAGRPGMGKTSFLVSIAMHAARLGVPVGLFSMEMDDTENMQRMVAQETGLSVQAMRNGSLTDAEFSLFVEAAARIGSMPLYIDDRGRLTLAQLEAKASRWYNEHGLGLLMVDYLQLMVGNGRTENRTQEVGAISRGLKQLARTLGIPVIAAAQLNRDLERRQDKRPMLADLRESGDQEQDADIVAFLYRDEMYNPASERANQCDVIIAKHRNGPHGTVPLYYNKELMKLGNLKRADFNLSTASPAYADHEEA